VCLEKKIFFLIACTFLTTGMGHKSPLRSKVNAAVISLKKNEDVGSFHE